MNILPIYDIYADTLLALGIAVAFDVTATYNGGFYSFSDEGTEDPSPLRFPVEDMTDEKPETPFTYHKFKSSAVTAFGGKQLLQVLEEQWNATEPQYEEIVDLVLCPNFNDTDWQSTRFYDVPKPWSGAATFRPMEAKGFSSPKASALGSPSTIKRFWLLDALRAIGFLTYAAPKKLNREAAVLRWQVMLPVVAEPEFQEKMIYAPPIDSSARMQVYTHLIASECAVPRVIVVEYAELNPMARTPMRVWSFEPLNLSADSIKNLKRIIYNMENLVLAEQHRVCEPLRNLLSTRDTDALSKFTILHNARLMSNTGVAQYLVPLEQETITDVLTCDRVIDNDSHHAR